MALKVTEVTSFDDFATVMPVESEAYDTPLNSFWEVFKGPSLEECTQRQWGWHEGTPGSRWLKVSDAETGEVLGASNWIVHEKNPFETPQPTPKATWWPEGDLKAISDQFLEIFFGDRPHRMNRPHVLLNILFVSSRARRRGVGRKMMEWGCRLADELGLESFVEATQMGKHLYAAFGFVPVGHINLTAQSDAPSSEWTSLYTKIAPEPFRLEIMWRPKDGKFEPGKTEYTWKERAAVDGPAVAF